MNMVSLTGTEKQIAWATRIRETTMERLGAMENSAVAEAMALVADAGAWIEFDKNGFGRQCTVPGGRVFVGGVRSLNLIPRLYSEIKRLQLTVFYVQGPRRDDGQERGEVVVQ